MAKDRQRDDHIVLSFHESLLRKSDVQLLRGPYWLNDQIISFYLEYLEKCIFQNVPQILFVSPEVTQCIKLSKDDVSIFLEPLGALNKSFIFFPINNHDDDTPGGSHWSLLVFSRPENIFWHFDSWSGANRENCQWFVKGLRHSLNAPGSTINDADCLQQENGYDCGIHVMCTVHKVAEYVAVKNRVNGAPKLTISHVNQKREEILNLIIVELGGKL